jgi:hypothetical protein
MEHTWKKKIGHGTMTFKTTGDLFFGAGFVHTATFECGDVTQTMSAQTPARPNQQSTLQPTREDVEKIFADFIFYCRETR